MVTWAAARKLWPQHAAAMRTAEKILGNMLILATKENSVPDSDCRTFKVLGETPTRVVQSAGGQMNNN